MYEHKEKYILDFSGVKTWVDIHAILEKEFDFPDYYGANWDAFWDCLTDMVGRPIHIEIIGLDIIEQKFGDEAKKMVDILKEFKHYEDDEFVDDITIDIIKNNEKTELQ